MGCGMMNELTPDIAAGFKEACFAIFGGGPYISEIQLAAQGKRLVDALELMGVLAKCADRLGKATGLNSEDVDIAISQPRKVAYLEETMRAMETGQLKIRVRSLENEQA